MDEIDLSNRQLTEIPRILTKNKRLRIDNNKLSQLKNIPNEICELYSDSNLIEKVENLPSSLILLKLGHNLIKSVNISNLNNLLELNLEYNHLKCIPDLPSNLKKLNISYNPISEINKLPESLEELEINNCSLENLNIYSTKLRILICENNYIKYISNLPVSLEVLKCGFNNIKTLPYLPTNLRLLICNNNNLICIPPLIDSLSILVCSNNELTFLPTLPENLIELDSRNNPFLTPFILPNNTLYFNGEFIECEEAEIKKPIQNSTYIKRQKDDTDLDLKIYNLTAFDIMNLEDYNVSNYIQENENHIIIKSNESLYTFDRFDLIKLFNNESNYFKSKDEYYFKLPWNQILNYKYINKIRCLDYSVFEIQKSLDNFYKFKLYKFKDFMSNFCQVSKG